MKNFLKKHERTQTRLLFITLILAAIYAFIFIKSEDGFSKYLISVIMIPSILALAKKLVDRMGNLFNTYQMHQETEYKYKNGLITQQEYKKRIHDLKEIEDKDSSYPINSKNTTLLSVKIKNIIKITLTACLLLFTIPPIIHLIVTTPSPLGFITPERQDAWINFYGAIIGGGLTLVGVWWTIDKQEEQRKDEFTIMHKPLLTINSPHFDVTENNALRFLFNVHNQGLTEALNIKVWLSLGDDSIGECFPNDINILPPNNEFLIKYPDFELHPYNVGEYNYIGESFRIHLTYSDSLKNEYYIYQHVYIHYKSKEKLSDLQYRYKSYSYNLTNYDLKKLK